MRASFLRVDLRHDPSRGLDPRTVYVALDAAFPDDRIVVTDNGRFIATVPNLIDAQGATIWIVGNAYGSVGLGLGAAIGAAAAHPDRPVLLVTGDGGFAMAMHELDAIRQARLDNVTIAIMNDELYGSDVKYLRRFGLHSTVLSRSRTLRPWPGSTEEPGTSVDHLAAIDFGTAGPTLLDVRVDPEVNV